MANAFWERRRRAIAEGAAAYQRGEPLSACPYVSRATASGSWGLGPWWRMGWQDTASAPAVAPELPRVDPVLGYVVLSRYTPLPDGPLKRRLRGRNPR